MFYNNQTEKFINFFDKLIKLEGRQQLNFPADIQEGSYSTAYGSGATPTPLIVPVFQDTELETSRKVKPLLNAQLKSNNVFKKSFDIWQTKADIIVKRTTKWKISHMPSLQDINADEYMLITKDEANHQSIVGVFYNKHSHTKTRQISLGSQEEKYPTDCVSCVSSLHVGSETLYVALNKRTKSSEPYSTEIFAFDLTSMLEIGFVKKQNTTCRMIAKTTESHVTAFMLTYILVLDQDGLDQI